MALTNFLIDTEDMPTGKLSFGQEVRRLRLQAGMTQEDLAERLDVTRVTISQIENGKNRHPSDGVLTGLERTPGPFASALARADCRRHGPRGRRRYDPVLSNCCNSRSDGTARGMVPAAVRVSAGVGRVCSGCAARNSVAIAAADLRPDPPSEESDSADQGATRTHVLYPFVPS